MIEDNQVAGSPDAKWVSEGDQPHPCNHADAAVGALQKLHGVDASLKDQLHLPVIRLALHPLLHAPLVCSLDLICQHIQQHLAQIVINDLWLFDETNAQCIRPLNSLPQLQQRNGM